MSHIATDCCLVKHLNVASMTSRSWALLVKVLYTMVFIALLLWSVGPECQSAGSFFQVVKVLHLPY